MWFSRPEIAAAASVLFGISTKPNPRPSPVNLSLITATLSTVPNEANASWRSLSVTLGDRLPTKIIMVPPVETPLRGRVLGLRFRRRDVGEAASHLVLLARSSSLALLVCFRASLLFLLFGQE